MTLILPEHFRKTTLELFGGSGERWLEQFPALLSELEQRWSITIGPPFDLSYNYVAPATRADGAPVVLKAGHPHPGLISEMEALKRYNGRGSVQDPSSPANDGRGSVQDPPSPANDGPGSVQDPPSPANGGPGSVQDPPSPAKGGPGSVQDPSSPAKGGPGSVRLLEHDEARGAMLLERLLPGVPLADLEDDDMATRIAAGVMRELWIPKPADPDHKLCTVEKWARGLGRLRQTFNGSTGPFPARLVEQAEALFADLLASSGPPMLLHGDLHHWNILSAERKPWIALDPKGLIGEAEYEVGALTRNRWPPNANRAGLIRQADRRLAIFSEMLGFDRQRMLHWCMAQAVLSAWWSYEDHRRVEEGMLEFAAALSEMIG